MSVWKTYALARSIDRGSQDEIDELKLREPTIADLRKSGMPFTMKVNDETGDLAIEFNVTRGLKLLGLISGVPLGFVETMHPADLLNIQTDLVGFFTQSPAIPTPDTDPIPNES
ncbi:MAG: phage tail assembly protein [Pseudomonadota bacterium]